MPYQVYHPALSWAINFMVLVYPAVQWVAGLLWWWTITPTVFNATIMWYYQCVTMATMLPLDHKILRCIWHYSFLYANSFSDLVSTWPISNDLIISHVLGQMCVCVCSCVSVHMCMCICACMHVYVFVGECMVCMYVCVYECMFI